MLAIFQYDFMLRAFLTGAFIGVIAPLMGTFLVARRYALLANTLAHSALPGVALGLFLGISPNLTALFVVILTAVGIERLRAGGKIWTESAMALFLSGTMAAAVVILSLAKGINANLFAFLFGSITTVAAADVYFTILLSLVTIGVIAFFRKEFFALTLDEELAAASGMPIGKLNLLFIFLTALTVAISLRIVGILLIDALMVIPVLTAFRIAGSFRNAMIWSVCLGLMAVFSGLFLSYYLNIASGGSIVLVSIIFFLLSLLRRP